MPSTAIIPYGYNVKKRAFNEKEVDLVIDPSLLLREPRALFEMKACSMFLPVAAIKWLGSLQSEVGETGRKARHVIRLLDSLKVSGRLTQGVKVNRFGGKLYVKYPERKNIDITSETTKADVDSELLHLMKALKASKKEPILLSVDSETRLLAHLAGFYAYSYPIVFARPALFHKPSDDLSGSVLVGKLTDKDLEELLDNGAIPLDKVNLQTPVSQLSANQYIRILDDTQKSALFLRYDADRDMVVYRNEITSAKSLFGLKPKNPEQSCLVDLLLDKNIEVVLVTGRAGTGKTLLSLAAGLQHTLQKPHNYERLTLIYRLPTGKSISSSDFLEEYSLKPIIDSFDCILMHAPAQVKEKIPKRGGENFAKQLKQSGVLTVEVLDYLRGRTFLNRFVVVDEAQNLSPSDVRLILTRAGEGTKFVFCGDFSQAENIDNPEVNEETNGLRYLVNSCRYDSFAAHINLKKCERSKLVETLSLILT